MAIDPNKPHFQRFGGLGDRAGISAHILKRTFFDGNVKVYEDEKGLLEKTEISSPNGRVVVNKETEQGTGVSKYKKIEIFSLDNEPLNSIDIIMENREMLNPSYRFYYGRTQIGRGKGEIAMNIAQKVLADAGGVDPRFTAGSEVDQEVIDTIIKILKRKTI